jgi:hypothetical protein
MNTNGTSHNPWRGIRYKRGVGGKRVCIVGYSHYKGEAEEDDPELTNRVVKNIISGHWRKAFFTQIRNCFGFSDHADFWNRVDFFNFVPEVIGNFSEKYKFASDEQISRANQRFVSIVRERRPQVVFVFTRKGWSSLRTFLGGVRPWGSRGFEHTRYPLGGTTCDVLGLRHPQGASNAVMRSAIRRALSGISRSA